MNNFYKCAQGVDVVPLMMALKANAYLWNQNTLRTNHPETAHGQVNDIWLRFNDVSNAETVVDDRESINYPAFFVLPQAQELIFALMARVRGERLGRCLITNLPVGCVIDAHVDGGAPAEYYERYHIVLHSGKGVMFRCGDETVNMQTGDIWWFNNQLEHEVINNSADDRIHLIVDIRVSK
jgi:hypothetical protein